MPKVDSEEVTIKLFFFGADKEAKEEFTRLCSLADKFGVNPQELKYDEGLGISFDGRGSFYWSFFGNHEAVGKFLQAVWTK